MQTAQYHMAGQEFLENPDMDDTRISALKKRCVYPASRVSCMCGIALGVAGKVWMIVAADPQGPHRRSTVPKLVVANSDSFNL